MAPTIKDFILLQNMTDKIGRIYEKTRIEKHIVGNVYFGQLGHGEGEFLDGAKISHMFKNVRIVDNNLIGDIVILDTVAGQILETMYNNNIKLHSAIRAIGNITTNNIVQIATFNAIDIMFEPEKTH